MMNVNDQAQVFLGLIALINFLFSIVIRALKAIFSELKINNHFHLNFYCLISHYFLLPFLSVFWVIDY